MDFTKLRPKSTENRLVDPIELFQNHKVSDPSINDLWLAQGDALREWHQHRDLQDIGIVLNTGAGKTLVGLLIAQSLVNEIRRHVLYACSSIQLVQQTAEKAHGYGLPATTYFKQEFSNDDFHRLEAPCITTYQALFNGRSKFFGGAVGAIIFDDAHTAEHLLRDQFSLRIDRDNLGNLYSSIVGLFADYHRRVGKAASYTELETADSDQLFLVPPFELRRQYGEYVNLLSQGGLKDVTETKFAWAHLKDHLDVCAVVVDAKAVTVTPPVVPVRSLPYFRGDTRRVYLSATLAAEDGFARTFGKKRRWTPFLGPRTGVLRWSLRVCSRRSRQPGLQAWACNPNCLTDGGQVAGRPAQRGRSGAENLEAVEHTGTRRPVARTLMLPRASASNRRTRLASDSPTSHARASL